MEKHVRPSTLRTVLLRVAAIVLLAALFAGNAAAGHLPSGGSERPLGVPPTSNVETVTSSTHPWPMFRHDLRHTAESPYTGPAAPGLLWRYRTGAAVRSSPAVAADGTIYVGSDNGYLYALNSVGSLKWRYLTGDAVESSPAIGTDGCVYVGSNDRRLYAINPNGTLRWRYATGGAVRSSPAIGSDGTVYVGSDEGYLYAIRSDGTLRWRHSTNTLPPYPQLYSSPAIAADGTIYVATGRDAYLYAINPDGSRKWGNFMASKASWGSPAVDSAGAVYVGSDAGCLHAYAADGAHKWSCTDLGYGAYPSSPAISGGFIYIAADTTSVWPSMSGGRLYAFSLADPSSKWSFGVSAPVRSSPAVDAAGTAYFGADDGCVYAIWSGGRLKWRYLTGDDVYSSPAIGADGTVYVGSNDGCLYALGDNAPPQNYNLWPDHGGRPAGRRVNFTATYRDLDGWRDLSQVFLHIGSSTAKRRNCRLRYDVRRDKMYLLNNTATAWLGGFAPGSPRVIRNRQCTLSCSKSTVRKSGRTVKVTWNLVFRTLFRGRKNSYMQAVDNAGARTPFQKMGTWRVK
jgi:outer membrane protein assembly factor BamB